MKDKKKWLVVLILIILLVIMMFAIVKFDKSNEYKVTFDVNGGTKVENQEVKSGDKLEKPEDPEKEGYEFIGWYYDGKKFDFDQEITEDIELEAKWMKKVVKYTITFDSQGGSEVKGQEITKGKKVTEPKKPTRYGYTFVGWQLDGKTFDFDTEIKNDITLKAVWKKNVISSKNKTTSTTVVTTTPEVAPSTPVIETTTEANTGTNDLKGDSTVDSKDETTSGTTEEPTVTKYTVSFYDGRTLLSAKEVEEGKLVDVPSNPNKSKYRFSAWICGNEICDFSQPITSDLEAYAIWIQIEIDVETLDEFKSALLDTNIETINLVADITRITESVAVTRTVTINGNDHELSFGNLQKDASGNASGLVISADNTKVNDLTISMAGTAGWGSHYAMQVYNAAGVEINNYTGTLADAALLVNGSSVELKGSNNVAGNEYGGIEVSRGANLTNNGSLIISGTLSMQDEKIDHPAIWIENGQGSVTSTGLTTLTEKGIAIKNQTFYYVYPESATTMYVDTLAELKAALAEPSITTIELTGDITGINESLAVKNSATINGNYYTLGFTSLAKDASGNASGLVISANNTTVNNLKITMPGTTGWGSHYAMQVYGATGVTVNNYTGSGADAALLVNGSTVTLTGTTTVTGNEYGGIEVSRGANLTNNGNVTINGTVAMADEAVARPALWIENGEATVTATGFTTKLIQTGGKDQTYYFLNAALAS